MAYLTLELAMAHAAQVEARLGEGKSRALDLLIDDRCQALGVLVELRAPSALWPAIRTTLRATWFGDETFLAVMKRYRFDLRLVDADKVREAQRIAVPGLTDSAPAR